MTPTGYTEDALVEQPAIALLAELGWQAAGIAVAARERSQRQIQ